MNLESHAVRSLRDAGGDRPPQEAERIVVVGGGASGALLAAELLRLATLPLHVVVVEPRGALGRGAAYATPFPIHLLNVPAGRLSGRADVADGFSDWLRLHAPQYGPLAFPPRALFGGYLAHVVDAARRGAAKGVRFEHRIDEVTDLGVRSDALEVRLACGPPLRADRIVLALGNLPPDHLERLAPGSRDPGRFVSDPWSTGALDFPDPDGDVLVLGSGLTAVDVVLGLRHRGHQGRVLAVSRRGLLPHEHAPVTAPRGGRALPSWNLEGPLTARRLLSDVRAQVRRIRGAGGEWRQAVDSLRPLTQAVWRALPHDERARFLRHLHPYWDIHRHRLAPQVSQQVRGLLAVGALRVVAGRIEALEDRAPSVQVRLRPRGASAATIIEVRHVVDCTGPGAVTRTSHPLVRRLLDARLVRADSFGLGLAATPEGRLISLENPRGDRLFAIGPLLRGVLWETTAIPEIRTQAASLAGVLLDLAGHTGVDTARRERRVRQADGTTPQGWAAATSGAGSDRREG